MLANTLSVDDDVGERTTASCVVKTGLNTRFHQGQIVDIYEFNSHNLIFRGIVGGVSEERPPGTRILFHTLSFVGFHYLADKRIIAKSYENMLAGDIVVDIISEKLAEESVSAGTIFGGPRIAGAVFNYVKVSQALDSIAEKAGYIWYIDFYRRLHFRPRTENIAPWIITSMDVAPDFSVEYGNPKYRNKQYIKGGMDVTDPQTQTFRGDGNTSAFTLGFRVARAPTITLNGVPQTVGIRGLEEGRDWYWSKGEHVISQDNEAAPITESDTLVVTYQGEFPIIAISSDMAEITTRAEIEANSGIVEEVDTESQTTSREAALQSANAKLSRYGVIGRRVKFRTKRKGLVAGQLATIDYPEHGLHNTEMLIESVTISDEDNVIWYDVTAVEGPEQGSWVGFFQTMADRGQDAMIRENIAEDEVLVTLAQFERIWEAPDHPNIFTQVYAAPDLYPSDTLFPAFDEDERVLYLSWFDGETEIGRKAVTKTEVTDEGDEITTTTFLAPMDANGTITHLGWWGGINATASPGTGVLVDRQPYAKEKTELEAIQVEKRDIRNFTPASGNLLITARFMSDLYDRASAALAKSV